MGREGLIKGVSINRQLMADCREGSGVEEILITSLTGPEPIHVTSSSRPDLTSDNDVQDE